MCFWRREQKWIGKDDVLERERWKRDAERREGVLKGKTKEVWKGEEEGKDCPPYPAKVSQWGVQIHFKMCRNVGYNAYAWNMFV